MIKHFEVNRDNLDDTRLTESTAAALQVGEARLAIRHFALTANNMTYAVFGDALRYWEFFPATGNWGRIPVWGFADVQECNECPLAIGERLYGFLPMSSHLTIAPAKVSKSSLVDGAAHRSELPAVYNRYSRCNYDPQYRVERETEQMVFQPLFTTSFLIDRLLANQAKDLQCIVSSASSKTAIGFAWLWQRRRDGGPIVGLTSPSNINFVRSLGIYDAVVAYADAEQQLANKDSLFVDIAGSSSVRLAVHGTLTSKLIVSLAVGASHWQDSGHRTRELPGPKPQLFFAPDVYASEAARIGPVEFGKMLAGDWSEFAEFTLSWLRPSSVQGIDSFADAYSKIRAGGIKPDTTFILENS